MAAAIVFGAALAFGQSDPEKDIKSKEPEKRVAAVAGLKALGGEKAEKALIGALGDRDWEVIEAAALALGELGAKGAVGSLVKTAIENPSARLRRAAAQSLARIDAVRAAEDLGKLTAGKSAARAWAAMLYVAASDAVAPAEALDKNLRKSQKAKETEEKVAAAGGILAVSKSEMLQSLEAYLGGDDIAYAAAALTALARRPAAEALPLLTKALARPRLDDVLERRLIAAVSAAALANGAGLGPEGIQPTLDALVAHTDAAVAARGMRLAGAMAASQSTGSARDAALAAIGKGLDHAQSGVRAAALHAGCGAKHEATLVRARAMAASDKDGRVRLIALRELGVQVGASDADVRAVMIARLKDDPEPLVREEAAVGLAKSPTDEAVAALSAGARDREWTVAACSAVSLGKTLQDSALSPLLALSKEADWRLRGAAIVGLCHLTKSEAVPAIMAALGDAEPAIARAAWNYLRALTKQDLPMAAEPWQSWWRDNERKVRMWTPQEVKERREKYGYSQSIVEVFRGLDVVVLDSRGDHIQKVLDMVRGPDKDGESPPSGKGPKGAIDYRMTAAARHKLDGLHPHAVYVSNCTGEVEPEDLERIAWFVRCGGYLFGSCWSLHETIEKVYPGVVRKFETSSEVVDTVQAEPCARESRYLEGVYDGDVEPEYNLEGAHLIEVLDRERCEVLVDSPQCATRWGVGNLAVWFRAGHGLILDSVNHFDNQGLTNANWLKEIEDRQAYAVDHMGLSFADLRATQSEKWWSGNAKAAEHVYDRTALRLVTNIVRSKRMEEP